MWAHVSCLVGRDPSSSSTERRGWRRQMHRGRNKSQRKRVLALLVPEARSHLRSQDPWDGPSQILIIKLPFFNLSHLNWIFVICNQKNPNQCVLPRVPNCLHIPLHISKRYGEGYLKTTHFFLLFWIFHIFFYEYFYHLMFRVHLQIYYSNSFTYQHHTLDKVKGKLLVNRKKKHIY